MSHPFAASLCKPWMNIVLCVLIILVSADLIRTIMILTTNNVISGIHFRFTALELRNSTHPPTNPGIEVIHQATFLHVALCFVLLSLL
jgi:hypothetical protein